jgi:hypothetical protein
MNRNSSSRATAMSDLIVADEMFSLRKSIRNLDEILTSSRRIRP